VIVVIGIMLYLGLCSCNLFKTRTSQEPTQSSSNRIPPNDPEIVLQNMIDAFRDKNKVNYLYSFSDASFVFEATAIAQKTYGSVFLSWDKKSEGDYFDRVMSKLQQNSAVTLKFDSISIVPIAADSSQGDTYYNLTVPFAETIVAKNFKGRAQFMFARDQSGDWSISQWLDIGLNTSDSTWSDLKGTFAH
jgi:hypothetical protein